MTRKEAADQLAIIVAEMRLALDDRDPDCPTWPDQLLVIADALDPSGFADESLAVEHGFMHEPTREERLEVVAAAAQRYLAACNTLAFRPTKEVETAAAQAHHDLTEALNALD